MVWTKFCKGNEGMKNKLKCTIWKKQNHVKYKERKIVSTTGKGTKSKTQRKGHKCQIQGM